MAKSQCSLIKNNLEKNSVHTCNAQLTSPIVAAVNMLSGKWKVVILYQLRHKTLRFGELKSVIPNISQKTLTQQLRALEENKLVTRHVYAEIPPRVEYSLTPLADKLSPTLDLLCDWGKLI
ncbi:Transcriptional regulator, HxlR family [Moritella sp. JT01]|uniref:winged helix-turn-helix transcriptional regulator n=1 Tax=Moritella sp. JT01 TaxID=756698 RepID=UPI000795A0B1|nr:helix-turn-helix domain-containing protein [Moritella sp. JT01]KXO06998.1 Transcriptional regulator, HxlR family [Moritella sp. JT01]